MKLILFDFDGTLTTKDSFLEFIKFTHSPLQLWGGLLLLSPILIGMKLGIFSNEFAKPLLLSLYYRGKSKEELEHLGQLFHRDYLPKILRAKGIAEIQAHQAAGQTLALVSASVEIWLKPFAEQMGMTLICTKAAYRDGKFIGKFDGKNCIGPEKVKRICEAFNLKDFDELIAYGDTAGDREMLALADQTHFKPFRD
ncbi:MAG: HAD-IB family hydrolase [Flammeovirgaceae bacterium]